MHTHRRHSPPGAPARRERPSVIRREPGRHGVIRRVSGRHGDDAGFTLLEMVVSMVIMSIFMAIFTASAAAMYRVTSKAEGSAHTASQVAMAFDWLDTSVRYANAISAPGTDAQNNWWVEWSVPYQTDATCTQLLFDSHDGQLKQRTWHESAGTVDGLTGWHILASHLALDDVQPFARHASDQLAHQQLTVHLDARIVGRSGESNNVSDVTFTALNSDTPPADQPVCHSVIRQVDG
jgi:prepilin-type N-terminal cleavage/methylation domain-containing protein